MTATGLTQDTRDYTSGVQKVRRILDCKGRDIRVTECILDAFRNPTVTVTAIIERGEEKSVYDTTHGRLTLDSNADIRVESGILYEPLSGVRIDTFLKGLLQIRRTVIEDINAVFNGVIFTVYLEDDIDDLYTEIDVRRRLIGLGQLKSYKY